MPARNTRLKQQNARSLGNCFSMFTMVASMMSRSSHTPLRTFQVQDKGGEECGVRNHMKRPCSAVQAGGCTEVCRVCARVAWGVRVRVQ